eukprot:TRINITY_DN34389_c0_g1_i1.p1 TRINITY_DN34389_c0_g1~~TRINITY_DN34389_c0_g1_i1.p1  ORF type:complete len:104 (+),score=21.00 TRINITY_DN34389_c0_g1_i1:128-439(+)
MCIRDRSLGGVYERFLADLDGGALFGLGIDYIVNYAYPALRGVDIRGCLPVAASTPNTIIPELEGTVEGNHPDKDLSLIHISEPTRLLSISYAVFCLKKKKHK